MGVLLSCCLKGEYEGVDMTRSYRSASNNRRQTLQSLISDRDNPNVDGRKHSAPPIAETRPSWTPPPSYQQQQGGSGPQPYSPGGSSQGGPGTQYSPPPAAYGGSTGPHKDKYTGPARSFNFPSGGGQGGGNGREGKQGGVTFGDSFRRATQR